MDVAAIIALMLSLQKPGVSVFSQVPVAQNSPPACTNRFMPACAAPRFNRHWNSFTRPETWQEGVRRYALIASTIHAVSNEDAAAKRWPASSTELSRYLIGVTFHESRFRRDIHAGRGAAGRGDCRYVQVGKKRTMIPGSCRSVCLGQIMKTRKVYVSPRGHTHESLVGVDAAATRRCIESVAAHLAEAHVRCGRNHGGRASALCVFGTYGGVPNPSRDDRIKERQRTFVRAGRPHKLSPKAAKAAGFASAKKTPPTRAEPAPAKPKPSSPPINKPRKPTG